MLCSPYAPDPPWASSDVSSSLALPAPRLEVGPLVPFSIYSVLLIVVVVRSGRGSWWRRPADSLGMHITRAERRLETGTGDIGRDPRSVGTDAASYYLRHRFLSRRARRALSPFLRLHATFFRPRITLQVLTNGRYAHEAGPGVGGCSEFLHHGIPALS